MKNFAIKLVWFTTIYVFVFAGLCQTTIPLPILMIRHCNPIYGLHRSS
ncbi:MULTISPECIES: hypothetical protein [unclassified Flavobacterium]|nr:MULTISPECIES: hypothetical protein [unclassified Flavobacterium]